MHESITQIRIEQARQKVTLNYIEKAQQEKFSRLEARMGAVEARVGNLEASVRELTT